MKGFVRNILASMMLCAMFVLPFSLEVRATNNQSGENYVGNAPLENQDGDDVTEKPETPGDDNPGSEKSYTVVYDANGGRVGKNDEGDIT